MSVSTFKRVFEPIQIGRFNIPNRVVRSAHGTWIGKGVLTDELIAYHEARAKGGVGLSFLEMCSVHPTSFTIGLNSYDDGIIARYQKLQKIVAPYGMAVFQQLAHGGVMYPDINGVALSASATPNPLSGVVPVAMTQEEIALIVTAFAQAARRCEEGGLAGVEIHAGHGYLFTQFLSTLMNRREDEYGGNLENRLRFLRETLRACRAAVSPGFPIGIRLSDEATQGGITAQECGAIVRALEGEGLIDFIHGSQGSYYVLPRMLPGMDFPQESMLPSSGKIVAGALRIPRILAAGRVRTLEEAEQLLRDDAGDLIVLQRAHIADPDLVRKSRAGRVEEVRPCISCNQGCVGGLLASARLGCAVNPAVGAELTLAEDLIVPAGEAKRVVVAGGGPAGMEAARLAALSGHEVILLEARADLGGNINIAKLAPRLQTLADITNWQERELYRLGVDVRTNTYVEAADILALRPDAVVVATGGLPRMDGRQIATPGTQLKGAGLPHVLSSVDLLTVGANRILPASALVFDDVGHYEALAVAQWLVERNVAVTFVTRFSQLAPTVESWTRVDPALEHLLKGEFRVVTRAQLMEIRPEESVVRQLASEKLETYPAELVVMVLSREPLNGLHGELRGKVPVLEIVGDAKTPRDLQAAIREGHMAGRFLFGGPFTRELPPG